MAKSGSVAAPRGASCWWKSLLKARFWCWVCVCACGGKEEEGEGEVVGVEEERRGRGRWERRTRTLLAVLLADLMVAESMAISVCRVVDVYVCEMGHE